MPRSLISKRVKSLLCCLPVSTNTRYVNLWWLIVKAYNITCEEADEVVEVANAMPVNRSTKAIPNNIPRFLFIITEILNCDNFI